MQIVDITNQSTEFAGSLGVRDDLQLVIEAHSLMGRRVTHMAIFNVFCDESDTHHSEAVRIFTVAGYVAFAQHWRGFDDRWTAALAPLGVDYFHMSEYEGERGVYGEKPEVAKAVFNELLDIIHAYPITPFAASINWADWRFIPNRKGIRDPYYDVMRFAMEQLTRSLWSCDGDVRILFFFERPSDDSVVRRCQDAFYRLKQRKPWGDRLLDISFPPKGAYRALEAADIIAYDVRKHELLLSPEERAAGGTTAPRRYSTRMLTREGREFHHWRLSNPRFADPKP